LSLGQKGQGTTHPNSTPSFATHLLDTTK
jgi:hypothetical protein